MFMKAMASDRARILGHPVFVNEFLILILMETQYKISVIPWLLILILFELTVSVQVHLCQASI